MTGQRAWFLGLLCFGMVLSMLMARRWLTPEASELAGAIEVYDVSAEALYGMNGFQQHEGAPQTWSRISLAYDRDPENRRYNKFLRCRMHRDEVKRTNPDFFRSGAPRRTHDDQPPAWWKQDARPEWFQPSGLSQWRMDQTQRGWIGQYLAFDLDEPDDSDAVTGETGYGWLSLWEWMDPQPNPAPLVEKPFGVDILAQEVGQQLIGQQWPVRPDGWLEAPGQVPPPQWRDQSPTVDCWFHPKSDSFILRLRQVEDIITHESIAEGVLFEPCLAMPFSGPTGWPVRPEDGRKMFIHVVKDPVDETIVRGRIIQRDGLMVTIWDWTRLEGGARQ